MNQGQRHITSIARRLPWLAAVAAPAWVAFGVMAAGGWVEPWPGLLGAGVTTMSICALLWVPLGQLDRSARRLREAAGAPLQASGSASMSLTEFAAAADDAARSLDRARDEAAAATRFGDVLIERLPVPILLLDENLRIRGASPAAASLLGTGLAGRDLIAVLRHPELIEAVKECLRGAGGRSVDILLPVPLERHLGARVESIAPGWGDVRAIVALHDLTALDKAERSRADFVANVSHELRTPLSSLIGFIETLRGPAREDRQAQDKFLGIMNDQAQRMARLVADLLSLSRIELNEHRSPTGRVSLGLILRAVADTLRPQAAARGTVIQLDAPPPKGEAPCLIDRLPTIPGDSDELTQVFQNLIDNAIKYSRERTSVRIACWLLDGDKRVAVAVSDEGEGIAREHLPRLTERFYRVDTARSRDLGGTGLGLAIVKHIVSRHRGELRIESEAGNGSTFSIILPILTIY